MSVQSDLRQTLLLRAEELFALCDREGKGYALREDMVYLIRELPLSPEQIEEVFDALDADGDGQLTLEEFKEGFGMFLGIDSPTRTVPDEEEDEEEVLEELLDHLGARNLFTDEDYVREMWHRVRKDDPVMRTNFENFITKMASDLKETEAEKETLHSTLKNREIENESRVHSLYVEMEEQLKREKEDALAREQRIEQQLRDELETELHEKDQQLQELLQRHAQMEKQLAELNSGEAETKHENQKLEKDRDILESRLAASEKMLHDMKSHLGLLRKKSLEEKRKRAQSALKVSEGIALERENLVLELQSLKEMNKQLLDEKDELTQNAVQLATAHRSVQRVKSPGIRHLYEISEESMEGIKTDYSQSEIQNRPVTLDRLLAEAEPTSQVSGIQNHVSLDNLSDETDLQSKVREIQNHPETLDKLLAAADPSNTYPLTQNQPIPWDRPSAETDPSNKALEVPNHSVAPDRQINQQGKVPNQPVVLDGITAEADLLRKSSEIQNQPATLAQLLAEADPLHKVPEARQNRLVRLEKLSAEADPLSKPPYGLNSLEYSDTESKILLGYEEDDEVDVLCNNLNLPTTKIRNAAKNFNGSAYTFDETAPKLERKMAEHKNYELSTPSRVYKVVFVGDSGVGKTSILQRFCNDDFKATFNATIGVDFQIRTVAVEGDKIALQLWDTAGQERFRSITQQYFRKADGIIVVYDVTAETSFKNVRNWMLSVQEGAEYNAVVLLMGNKIDLCESDNDRVVKTKDGERMADEYGTLFYETSAKTGSSIQESIEGLASLLKSKEDETIEKVLKLQEELREKRKKTCC